MSWLLQNAWRPAALPYNSQRLQHYAQQLSPTHSGTVRRNSCADEQVVETFAGLLFSKVHFMPGLPQNVFEGPCRGSDCSCRNRASGEGMGLLHQHERRVLRKDSELHFILLPSACHVPKSLPTRTGQRETPESCKLSAGFRLSGRRPRIPAALPLVELWAHLKRFQTLACLQLEFVPIVAVVFSHMQRSQGTMAATL